MPSVVTAYWPHAVVTLMVCSIIAGIVTLFVADTGSLSYWLIAIPIAIFLAG